MNPYDALDATEDLDAVGGPDGLTNLQEYIAGTDPNNADTDGDTLLDGADPSPLSKNALPPGSVTVPAASTGNP